MTIGRSISKQHIMGAAWAALFLVVAMYWCVGLTHNVYANPVSGAIAEALWLPAMALTFGIPVTSFILWQQQRKPRAVFLLTGICSTSFALWLLFH